MMSCCSIDLFLSSLLHTITYDDSNMAEGTIIWLGKLIDFLQGSEYEGI